MPRTSPPGAAGRPAYDRLLAFEAILAASPLNVTVYDRDFVVRDVSAAAAELAGRPRAALLGRSLAHDLPEAQLAYMKRVLPVRPSRWRVPSMWSPATGNGGGAC